MVDVSVCYVFITQIKEPKMPSETDRRGKLLPNPVTPPDTVCFTIRIPNAVQYRAAFLGQINVLGVAETWDHPTDGTECLDCEEAAQLWRNAIFEASFSDDCGDDMSCQDVADCIENDPVTKSVVQNIVNNMAQPQAISIPGQAMTPAQYNPPINPLENCDLDAFWAQCSQFTEYFTQAGTDFIEKIEVYSNAVEAAGFIEMAPILGTIIDEVQIDEFLEFIDWAIEIVGEFYNGALTTTLKEEIACAYFCAGRDDCELTIERIWLVQNERLGGLLIPSEINTVSDLVSAIVTIGTNPGLAVDIWLAFLAGMAKLAGYLGVRGIDQTLSITLKLAVNDANNDWQVLCTDCPENDWCYFQDTKVSVDYMELDYTQDGYNYITDWNPGVGVVGALPGALDEDIPKVNLPQMRRLTQVSFDVNVTSDTSGAAGYLFIDGVFVGTQPLVVGPQTVVWGLDRIPAEFVMIGVDRSGGDRRPIGPITAWQITGEGDNPFGTDNCS